MSVNHGGKHALLMKREDLWIGGGVELLKQGGGGGAEAMEDTMHYVYIQT